MIVGHYCVHFVATASHAVEVDADSREEADELASDRANFPYFSAGMSGDIGDWEIDEVDSDDEP